MSEDEVKKLSVQSLLAMLAIFLAAWAFNRTMGELDNIGKELKEIRLSFERNNVILSEHERRISRLEAEKRK